MGARLPFVFTGVVLYASAATRLLVRLTRTGPDSWGLRAVDPAGAAVISIDSVTLRAVSDTALSALSAGPAPGLGDSLFELAWLAQPDTTEPTRWGARRRCGRCCVRSLSGLSRCCVRGWCTPIWARWRRGWRW